MVIHSTDDPTVFAEIGYDRYYEKFANDDRFVTALVRTQVPSSVAKIIEDGMVTLFQNLYSGSVSVEDSLSKIETQANEKWSTLK